MEYKIYDELNPGAKALLDSFLNERKQKIFDYIAEKALKENKHISDLSAKDIFEIQQTLDENQDLDRKRKKRILTFTIFSFMGGIYGLVGSLMLYMRSNTSLFENIYLLMIVLGVFITVFSSLTVFLRELSNRQKDLFTLNYRYENENLYNEIISIWRTIENLSLNKLESETNQVVSSAKILNWLMSTELLNKDDHVLLKKIINLRNIAVHKGPSNEISRNELKDLINKANRIIDKLSSV